MSRSETALITGASSGIGHELAKLFAADRYNLVLVARNEARLSSLAKMLREKHGVDAHVYTADLGNPTTPQQIYDRLHKLGVKSLLLTFKGRLHLCHHFPNGSLPCQDPLDFLPRTTDPTVPNSPHPFSDLPLSQPTIPIQTIHQQRPLPSPATLTERLFFPTQHLTDFTDHLFRSYLLQRSYRRPFPIPL
jgi:short chain dehydrogenase